MQCITGTWQANFVHEFHIKEQKLLISAPNVHDIQCLHWNQFARELKKLLIKGCCYSIQEYLNEEFTIIGY
jgi:hypothetical protein